MMAMAAQTPSLIINRARMFVEPSVYLIMIT